jgi:hypothetical protein
MFPRVKRSDIDLEALGRELLERKMELEAELQAAAPQDTSASDDTDDTDEGEDGGRSRGGMAAKSDDES